MEQFINIVLPIVLVLMSGIFGVLWHLLKKKDEAQGLQIALLFVKHDDDANRLRDLELDIARRHYERPELDAKFDKLDTTFREGFRELGKKVEHMTELMASHVDNHHRGS